MSDLDEERELLAVAVEALSEISGLGGEPGASIARAALEVIEQVTERGEAAAEG